MTKNEARFLLTLEPNASVSIEQFEEAYRTMFRTDLHERLKGLVNDYGTGPLFSWELEMYGWKNPSELLTLIN